MTNANTLPRRRLTPLTGVLFALVLAAGASAAHSATFHLESVCRTDPAVNNNAVAVTLHDDASHSPLPDVRPNALWTFVDYRQNRAVFRYKVASCTTDRNGVGTFSGGSGRARWQLAEVVGYDLGSATFDTAPTTLCPNTLMIDFW